jgi:hypothetical protein
MRSLLTELHHLNDGRRRNGRRRGLAVTLRRQNDAQQRCG